MPSPVIQGDPPPRVRRVRRALADHAQVTRLARGLASGSSIEHANKNMLAEAIAGRQKV